jgi:biopolymer transport protein ExbD
MGIHIGAGEEGDADVMVEMNTTPLIDVMLVLLVMLIITIPIQLHSVNLDMPSAAAVADQPEIHLRPDRRAKYDSVAGVLAAAQRHGLAKVGLVGSEQFLP